jgi:hypothetical protein
MSNDAAGGSRKSGEALDRAAAAIRASAAAATPSERSVRAMLDTLVAMERGHVRGHVRGSVAGRQVVRSGKGSLSLNEDSLMRKWRFHDAFRPLSFEALERRRLLAAVSVYQDDGGFDRRGAWPDSFFLPIHHTRGDRPQRRWDTHPEPCEAREPESDALMDGRLNELASSQLFGSELIFAA